MKQIHKILLLAILAVSLITPRSDAGDWKNFNKGWKFTKGNPENAKAADFDDSLWENVTVPHWNWNGNEGKNVPVFVYTNGDEAELFLNGKSLGKRAKKPLSNISKERYRLMWFDVLYEPGELKAVAYKEGKVIGEAVVKTAGEPYSIKLTPDRSNILATGDDLIYVLVEACDKVGNLCPLAENMINFEIEGPGEIAGVGNGNPQSLEPFVADHRKLFYGKAMLIIRSKENEDGKIQITANSKGLKTTRIYINTKLEKRLFIAEIQRSLTWQNIIKST